MKRQMGERQMGERRVGERRGKRRVRVPKGFLPFKQWGGARPNAGRKAKGGRACVGHGVRGAVAARFPVLVTVGVVRGLPALRRARAYAALRGAFAAGCDRFGFRLVHYAVLGDHVHMLVEAEGRESLSRGLQGLLIRMARALNRVWGRKGKVFADRYHERVLKTPREVRNGLVYVLGNAHKHHRQGAVRPGAACDVFTSGPWFEGWAERVVVRGLEAVVRPVVGARTWLLGVGWRRYGPLRLAEVAAVA